jgi:glycosyltransferase involved in cell wall biosynthesis
MDNIDLVSIIIPVYNRPDSFRNALKSALAQTYPAIEIVAVDDGSTEDITGAISDLGNPEIRLIRQINSGPGIARKNGLKIAQGKYIQYLDSDDEILPDKIAKQVAVLEKNTEAVLCYSPTLQISSSGQKAIRKFSDQPCEDLLATALQWRRWSTSSCLWRYPDKTIPFWPHLYNGEDIVHDVSVGVRHQAVCFQPEMLTLVYQDGSGVSARPSDPEKFERYKMGIVEASLLCLEILEHANFTNLPRYANPMAERMYHGGLLLAKLGDMEKSLTLLGRARSLTKSVHKRLEIIFAQSVVLTARAHYPEIYSFLFRLHRKLVKPQVHVYRSV